MSNLAVRCRESLCRPYTCFLKYCCRRLICFGSHRFRSTFIRSDNDTTRGTHGYACFIVRFVTPVFLRRSLCDADLTKAEQEALAFVYDLRNKFESGDIPLEEPQEKGILGAFKKAFQQ